MNIQHSSRSDSWMTPVPIVEAARSVLGEIDLDPATHSQAQTRVKAKHFFTAAEDALSFQWCVRVPGKEPLSVFCNPPGGKVGNRSKTQLFWHQLLRLQVFDRLKHAVFLAFSIEALQTTQKPDYPCMLQFPICVPRTRVKFDLVGRPGACSPSHSNVIVYVPGTVDRRAEFKSVFEQFGYVKL